MRQPLIRIAFLGALILANPVGARADGTVLLGLMTLDGPRPSVGVAFGISSSSPSAASGCGEKRSRAAKAPESSARKTSAAGLSAVPARRSGGRQRFAEHESSTAILSRAACGLLTAKIVEGNRHVFARSSSPRHLDGHRHLRPHRMRQWNRPLAGRLRGRVDGNDLARYPDPLQRLRRRPIHTLNPPGPPPYDQPGFGYSTSSDGGTRGITIVPNWDSVLKSGK